MQSHARWMVVALLIVGAHLWACSEQEDTHGENSHPATVEKIPDSKFSRVKLSPKAAERLDVRTDEIREFLVMRKRRPWGEVVAPQVESANGAVWVRVPLIESDLNQIEPSQQARVLPLSNDNAAAGLTARPVQKPPVGDFEEPALYYAVESAGHGLVPGQYVRMEAVVRGSGTQRKIVPFSAVLYGPRGETWVYTSPEPLTFIRHPIAIDYVDGDQVVLTDGPSPGTKIVTVGVVELYGAESGIGH
jgi:multidrug efflux pump subunit AcrA (membrane-fusion protein)